MSLVYASQRIPHGNGPEALQTSFSQRPVLPPIWPMWLSYIQLEALFAFLSVPDLDNLTF